MCRYGFGVFGYCASKIFKVEKLQREGHEEVKIYWDPVFVCLDLYAVDCRNMLKWFK